MEKENRLDRTNVPENNHRIKDIFSNGGSEDQKFSMISIKIEHEKIQEQKIKEEKIAEHMRQILLLSNPELTDELMEKTPMRYAKALTEFTQGYRDDIDSLLKNAVFTCQNYKDLIIVQDITFISTCEHHLLPFYGECIIGYVPNEKILGLSKFPRLVNSLSKKFQLQERLTRDIAEILNKYLDPEGIIVLMKASHSCMCFRGVKSWTSQTKTIYKIGTLNDKENLQRFMDLVQLK